MKKLIVSTLCCYLYVQTASAQNVDAGSGVVTNQGVDGSGYQVLEVQYNKNETYYIRQMGQDGKLAQVTYPWQTAYQGQQQYYQGQSNHDQQQRAQAQPNSQASDPMLASDNHGFNNYRGTGSDIRF